MSIWPQVPLIKLVAYGVTGVVLLAMLVMFINRVLTERHPLGHIPGPFLARLTPLWIAYQARRGRRYLAVAEAHEVRPPGLSPFHATLTLGAEIRRLRAGCAKPHLSLA